MNHTDINRVRDDLAMMKQAAGVGLPIGRSDVWLSLAWAAAGVPLASWAAYSPPEPMAFGLLVIIPSMGVLALSAFVAKKYHRDRGKAPAPWREHRFQWIAAGVLTPVFGGFVAWGIVRGLSPEALTVTALFMAGLGTLILPILDRTRLFYLGWAVSTMLFAVTAPLLGQRYFGVLVGGWLILSGLSAAGIMGWQIHRSVDEHATD
ncbi:MAG: hypothetical protein IH895_01065 [Planctomycetes bacterium]|nr:hypothetical protein [Planctomycetota bacterium]